MYDVIIIGAGPAGLAAGLYCGRSKLNTLIIEKSADGGQITITEELENYPGGLSNEESPESSKELIARMTRQVAQFGAERVSDEVTKVELEGKVKKVHTRSAVYETKAVIVANGASPRLIGCPGEREFTGRGVSFCATCDAAFFEDMEVFVVGGGDTALEEALYISKFARKITIIHMLDHLQASTAIRERVANNDKISIIYNTVVTKLDGDGLLSRISVKNTETDEEHVFEADPEDGVFGIFIFIGYIPNTQLYEGQLDMEYGYVIGDERMRTNLKGVYVAGDIRSKPFRQVVMATSDGAVAAMQLEHDMTTGELD